MGHESPGYTLCVIRDLRQICLDSCIVYSRHQNACIYVLANKKGIMTETSLMCTCMQSQQLIRFVRLESSASAPFQNPQFLPIVEMLVSLVGIPLLLVSPDQLSAYYCLKVQASQLSLTISSSSGSQYPMLEEAFCACKDEFPLSSPPE